MATDLAREVSDRVRTLGSHLENREPAQLLDDARDFARRRPGTFLLGALAAGVVAGRLFRATADGAAAASLADSGTHRHHRHDRPAGTTYGTGVGTGPMATASGSAAWPATDRLTDTGRRRTDRPGTTGTTPRDPDCDPEQHRLVDRSPGQRTQDRRDGAVGRGPVLGTAPAEPLSAGAHAARLARATAAASARSSATSAPTSPRW